MDADDLQTLWRNHHRHLEDRITVNETALRTILVERAESRLFGKLMWRAAGVVVDLVLVAALCVFGWHNRGSLPLLLSAVVVVVFVAAVGRQGLRQVILIRRLELSGPVTSSQRVVAQLAMAEYRAVKWVLLMATLVWVPMLAIIFKVVTGQDLFALASPAWVLSNLGLGVVALVVGQWLSRRYVERPGLGPRARRIVEFVGGATVRRLQAQLDQLSRFEHESGSPSATPSGSRPR